MTKFICLLSLFFFSFTNTHAQSNEANVSKDMVDLGGELRFRFNVRNNSDLNNSVSDFADTFVTRVRLNVRLTPIKSLEAFVQPQFAGSWGQVESNLSGSGTITSGALTSGALNDPDLSIHQAWAFWHFNDNLGIKLGRQEMNYGDQAVIGAVNWSDVGRSFDAALLRANNWNTVFDWFYSKLSENAVSGSGLTGSTNFAGLYASSTPATFLSTWDNYALWFHDNRTGSPSLFSFATLGTRMSRKENGPGGTIEGNVQVGKASGANMLAYMVLADLGYTFDIWNGIRVAGEFNRASGNDGSSTFTRYNQLFPTAHKFLGYLDFFGRQNIQSGVFHLLMKFNKRWKGKLDIHSFWRVESTDVLYSLATEKPITGQANPPTSTKMHVGEEVDLLVNYSVNKWINLEFMGGVLRPGAYLKNTIGNDLAFFTYVQTKFSI